MRTTVLFTALEYRKKPKGSYLAETLEEALQVPIGHSIYPPVHRQMRRQAMRLRQYPRQVCRGERECNPPRSLREQDFPLCPLFPFQLSELQTLCASATWNLHIDLQTNAMGTAFDRPIHRDRRVTVRNPRSG